MSNPLAQETMGDDEPEHADILEELQVVSKNPEDECKCGSARCQEIVLSRELDTILDPTLTYRSLSQLERIWPLLTNRSMEISSFLNLLSEYQAERHCGTAWLQDFVAYRCRTCSDSPNMAICAECFKNGNHRGHDYNMFKSGSGGACDCGFDIVKESGHCSRHGQNVTAKRANETVPETLICVPRRIMPRLIHRLAIQLRKSLADISVYLDFLMQIANSSAVLRSLMIEALISADVYSSQIQVLSNRVGNKQAAKTFKDGLKYLEHEQKCLKPFKVPKEWRPPTHDIKAFCDNLPITCFIDELVFWMIVYELPEKLVCFLLGLFMDDNYTQTFARSFVRNYPRILLTLIGIRGEPSRHLTRESYDKLSRRILHVSVRLYCHSELTRKLCDEEYVLHTIIYCLRAAIEGTPSDSGVLEPNRLCPPSKHMPMVVNTEGALIRDRHLRSFTGDLYNILACENEVLKLLNDSDLLNTWIEMLSNFQTMNPYKRELAEHAPYETGPHLSVFAVEADFCHSPMWSLLSCLKKETILESSESLLSALHANMSRWFYRMGIGPSSLLDPYHMSFHIPLHRMFAATMRNMMFTQKVSDQDLHKFISCNQALLGTQYSYRSASGAKTPITFIGFVKMLLLHPLQALTLYNEIRNTMWTRNGISIINQAITYVHCACSFSTVDLDMFLLKYSASKLNPNYFIKTLLSRFHAWKWLSFKSNILMNESLEETRQLYHFNILPEQVISMIESSLVTLIQLLTLSIYCNVSEKEQTRTEMVALISVIDRTHSYLLNMLPDRGVTNFGSANEDFVSLLDELTIYKPAQHGTGGNLQQGSYTLKSNIWDMEYDPIQVLYRFYQKRDYQMSLERFFQHAKLTGKLNRRYHPSTLWPPLKIPKNLGSIPPHLDLSSVFGCQAMLGLIFTIIHKNIYYSEVPDSIMAYTIHLLELSLRSHLLSTSVQQDKSKRERPTVDPSFNGRYSMKELSSCPAYFGSKDESNIKGNTIFSVPDAGNGETSDDDHLFPVVKNALDLGFESTWFPFDSILENCLVHLENVHLLPWREFETLLESQQDPESNPDKAPKTGVMGEGGVGEQTAAQSSDAEMYWSEQEYDETGIEEMIDDIDSENDDDDDDDDDDDEDDDLLEQGGEDIEDNPVPDGNLNAEADHGNSFRISFLHADRDSESEPTENSMQQQRATASDQHLSSAENSSTARQAIVITESLPESQSNALSLIPIRNTGCSSVIVSPSVTTGNRGSLNANPSTANGANNNRPVRSIQIHPENLVTQRRALEAPEAIPMLEDSPQPLALETSGANRSDSDGSVVGGGGGNGSGGSGNSVSSIAELTSSAHAGAVNSKREERSLSEMDIYARFVGFFQPRQESQRSHLRGFRQRQTARRGGYRAPMTPLAVHNPNNNNPQVGANASAAATAYVTHPIEQGAAAAHNNNNNNNNDTNSNNNNNSISPNESEASPRGEHRLLYRTATTTTTMMTTTATSTRDPRLRRPTQCSCTLLNRTLSSRLQQDMRQRRLRRDRMHHGESLLSLLLRLHAKYSNRANSYEYNEHRAKANLSPDRTRVGDGVHFVAIVLDLICHSNQKMLARVGQLQRLIWAAAPSQTAPATGSAFTPTSIDGTTKMQLDDEDEDDAHQHQRQGEGQFGSGATAKLENSDQGVDTCSGGGANQVLESGSSKVMPSASLDPDERRRRAKEFQSRLMADFANRQRAFMEKYGSSQTDEGNGVRSGGKSDKIKLEPDEEPINLSSKMSPETRPQMSGADKEQQQPMAAATAEAPRQKQELTPTADNGASSASRFATTVAADEQQASTSGCSSNTTPAAAAAAEAMDGQQQQQPTYECCICGSDSSSTDLTNPLGQVVLLQATSVYGHAHLRPRHERLLPCDDVEQLQLQEGTYAKYLARRIDLMCEHFCESSRLDTINIGAEGGVHVQSCGHYLHIECHQSYIKSLDQEDRPHARQDTDGFLCPVCRQLANSVLPILGKSSSASADLSSHHTASASEPGTSKSALDGVVALKLEQQIKLIGSLLEHRSAPNQRELKSSASFCQHLTKATGSEYRRIKSEPNMHSLFLFLTSIARTNLETEVIMRSSKRIPSPGQAQATSCGVQANSSGGGGGASSSSSSKTAAADEAPGRQRSCFLLLFQVLALNSRTLIEDHWFTYDQLWAHLTHQADEKNRFSVKPMKRSEVPMLLRDPTAMLLQFLFAITDPKHLSYQATHFTCLVQMLFNLTVIQSIALVLSYLRPQDKAKLGLMPGVGSFTSMSDSRRDPSAGGAEDDDAGPWSANESSQLPNVSSIGDDKPMRPTEATTKDDVDEPTAITTGTHTNQFSHLLASVLSALSPLLLPTNEEPLLDQRVRSRWSNELLVDDGLSLEVALALVENRTKLACLPFLRGAALIRHHLYGLPLPDLESLDDRLLAEPKAIEADFSKLISYLQLGTSGGDRQSTPNYQHCSGVGQVRPSTTTTTAGPASWPLVDALNWPPGAQESLVSSWSAELLRFGSEFSIAARSLLVCRPLAWHRPSLMQLPDFFDDIFLFYYRKECSLCHQVPKDVAICLVCGAPVCFRNGCCKARSGSRQLHSHHCGAGTAIFLAIQTSSIVVIRGNRACVWGSVYLDAHDEEDSGLQRGKPLHLVQARYRLLEDQWLTHTFDHTCGKRWIYLQEN